MSGVVDSRQSAYLVGRWWREGYALHDIAAAAGVSTSTLSSLLNDPNPTVLADTHHRIVGLTVESLDSHAFHVNVAGTRRRVRHLQLCGYSYKEIAHAAGCAVGAVHSIAHAHTDRVRRELRDRLRDAFDILRHSGGTSMHAERTRQAALARGWLPITAFTDPDDPASTPKEEAA